MLKPTDHYDKLREALEVYLLDANYSTLEECVAHALFDVMIWAQNLGIGRNFPDALRLSYNMAIEQHEKVMRVLSNLEVSR